MNMKNAVSLIIITWFIGFSLTAKAVQPDEILSDKHLEERARDISANLRCPVCQNETIDDSNSSLARDLRFLVRERLVNGDSDKQVINYLVARYGEYILLKPRFKGFTVLLWFSPIFILIAIFIYILYNLKLRTHLPQVELTDEEKKHLQKILED